MDKEEQTNGFQGKTSLLKCHKKYTHTHTPGLTDLLFAVQLHSWQPGIKNPYRGMVVWPVPENIDISVTLFKVRHQDMLFTLHTYEQTTLNKWVE